MKFIILATMIFLTRPVYGLDQEIIQKIEIGQPSSLTGYVLNRLALEKCIQNSVEKDIWKSNAEAFKNLSSNDISKSNWIWAGFGASLAILLMEFAK